MTVRPTPRVGDTVRLNDHGLRSCFGSTVGLAHMKSLEMKITSVGDSMCADDAVFDVSVDCPEINQFMINNWDFDIVSR